MNKKNSESLKDRIVAFLAKQPAKRFKSKTIARHLGIQTEDYTSFRNYLRDLSRDGVITKAGRNAYKLQPKPSLVIGRLRVKTQGYGFVQLEESDQEVFISQRNMANALDGDLVAVYLFAHPKKDLLPEGKIDHIIERKREHIVGTFKQGKYFDYVDPDNIKIPYDIIVHGNFTSGAKPGQKVVVTIDYWENRDLNPTGKITEILGFPEEAGVDIASVLYSFNLSPSFPKSVEKESRKLSTEIREEDLEGRLDLRDNICFTIDPPDAKDFDDAVSLEIQEDGTQILGVHIADVSHYISEGSEIDKEALKRATSVYLVDRVVPMLPETLSNKICSLQPNQDRLTFSVILKLDQDVNVLDVNIRPSVIHSKRRFTYEEVQTILDTGEGEFFDILIAMRNLSQVLFRKRLQAGSLDFETPEVKVELDENGTPVAIHRRQRLQSHQLIEEFMLLANRAVTEQVNQWSSNQNSANKKLPFVYRIHEKPSKEKMTDFANLVRSLGFQFKERKKVHPKHLQNVLSQVRGLPEEDIINQVMLRSLMKAKYDTRNVGHFGLAFKNYTHFTSPIRRYPDLVVHRLLREYANSPSNKRITQLKESLPEICRIASEQEINALEAERHSVKIKQTEFMVDKLGEVYDGIISGIVPFGIFVEILDYVVEGLVHVKDLSSDYYIYDEPNYRLIGKTTGKVYRLGDRIKVKVIRVVPEERLIDFQLLEEKLAIKKKPKRRVPNVKTRKIDNRK